MERKTAKPITTENQKNFFDEKKRQIRSRNLEGISKMIVICRLLFPSVPAILKSE